MQQKIASKILFFITIIIAFYFTNNKHTTAQTTNHPDVVYDTIFVYDTIWSYETIYDTIWYYDTIYIDSEIEHLTELPAIQIEELVNSFDINPFKLSFSEQKNFNTTSYSFSYKAKTKVKHRLTNNQIKKSNSKSRIYTNSSPSISRLTLNPFKGEFDPQIFKNGEYSIEAYGGINYQLSNYSFNSNDDRDENIANATQLHPGYEYGLKLNYQIEQLKIQSGIGILNYNETLNYNIENIQHDTIIRTTTIEELVTFKDTLLLHSNPDNPLLDSTRIVIYVHDSIIYRDSSYIEIEIDTTFTPKSEIIDHYLLEVPLLFSWQIRKNKLSIGLKYGIINQIHLFSEGEAYGNYEQVLPINEVTQFTKYNIALYGGIDCSYQLSRLMGIGFDAYYKHPLRRFASTFNAYQSKRSYGCNLYLRLKI